MTQTVSSPLFTLKEAMEYLRCSRSTLYRLMWSGQLPRYKIGSTMRFYKTDLDGCIKWTPPPLSTMTDEVHQHI